VFLDDHGRAIRLVHSLKPSRISPRVPGASGVLELPAGTLERAGVAEGARIEITGEAATKRRIRFDLVGTLVANLTLALLYGFFVTAHASKIAATGQWGTAMPLVVQEAMLVGLVLARRRSVATSGRSTDWILGIGGTLLPLLMRPQGVPGPLSWLGEPLQFV